MTLPLRESASLSSHRHRWTQALHVGLLLVFGLRYQFSDGPDDLTPWIQMCHNDFKMCPGCFDRVSQDHACDLFRQSIKLDTRFLDILTIFQNKIRIRYATHLGRAAVIKYALMADELLLLRSEICEQQQQQKQQQSYDLKQDCSLIFESGEQIETILVPMIFAFYKKRQRPGSVRVLPYSSIKRMIATFGEFYKNPLTAVILLNMNPEAMLMRTMFKHDLPVPEILLESGFLYVQSYAGRPLVEFYKEPFRTRLTIARNILVAALKFTNGVDGFRIYHTDLTPDNIVVDEKSLNVTFVDLDSVIIVDAKIHPFSISNNASLSSEVKQWQTIHRHEIQPCSSCFAYVEDDLGKHNISDHNLYAACALFVQDIHGNTNNGFLYTLPNIDDQIQILIGQCMQCKGDCPNRFSIIDSILRAIDNFCL